MCFWCKDKNGMVAVILIRESVAIDAAIKSINCESLWNWCSDDKMSRRA